MKCIVTYTMYGSEARARKSAWQMQKRLGVIMGQDVQVEFCEEYTK